MIRAASLGAIAITFAEYFFRVLGLDPLAPAQCDEGATGPRRPRSD